MNRRRSNSIKKNIKDYIVPIIWGILVLILIVSLFSWDENNEVNTNTDIENSQWLDISLDSNSSEATVVYAWDYKKEIEGDMSLYKWEKIIVKESTVSVNSSAANFKVNKLGEFKYLENGDYALYSGDLWVNSKNNIDLEMKFWYVSIWANSNISFSQNEMWSTIYLISWFAEVSNLVWESTVLDSGQKVTISRSEASDSDLDLSLWKDTLDEYFLRSDWFIVNWWSALLTKEDELIEWDSELSDKNKIISSNKNLIYFNNLLDESNVSSSSVSISWTYDDDEITKIVLNWTNATINKELKTFKFENVDVSKVENDLVFKAYDDANEILSRFVYTVYYNAWTESNSSAWSSVFKVKTFDVDWSQFTFTAPTSKSTYTTYETFVTIKWKVLADSIDKVTVNDYQLNSFNWSTWRYHADTKYNNLWEGTNVYEIKYYSWWKLVYTNHFTIIKKTRTAISTPTTTIVEKETSTISWEANIN
jgi:hypothetical protein